MLNGSYASLDTDAINTNCAFCLRSNFATNILKETDAFFIVADHAPLVEGHILILPKRHFACYGVVPAELDAELLALKREVQDFFSPQQRYEQGAPLIRATMDKWHEFQRLGADFADKTSPR